MRAGSRFLDLNNPSVMIIGEWFLELEVPFREFVDAMFKGDVHGMNRYIFLKNDSFLSDQLQSNADPITRRFVSSNGIWLFTRSGKDDRIQSVIASYKYREEGGEI